MGVGVKMPWGGVGWGWLGMSLGELGSQMPANVWVAGGRQCLQCNGNGQNQEPDKPPTKPVQTEGGSRHGGGGRTNVMSPPHTKGKGVEQGQRMGAGRSGQGRLGGGWARGLNRRHGGRRQKGSSMEAGAVLLVGRW